MAAAHFVVIEGKNENRWSIYLQIKSFNCPTIVRITTQNKMACLFNHHCKGTKTVSFKILYFLNANLPTLPFGPKSIILFFRVPTG